MPHRDPEQPLVRGRGVTLDRELVRFDAGSGTLELDFRPRLDVRLRLGPWDGGLELSRHEAGRWQVDPDDPQLFFFGNTERLEPDHPMARFTQTIPAEALAIAAGFSAWHLTVLRLLRVSRTAARIGHAVPNLLWLIAANVDRRGVPLREAPRLLRRSRLELLGWCLDAQLPRAALRFVRQLLPTCRDRQELELLETALRRREGDVAELMRLGPLHSDALRAWLGEAHQPLVVCEGLSGRGAAARALLSAAHRSPAPPTRAPSRHE